MQYVRRTPRIPLELAFSCSALFLPLAAVAQEGAPAEDAEVALDGAPDAADEDVAAATAGDAPEAYGDPSSRARDVARAIEQVAAARDSDRDGLPDRLEIRTGTEPFDADTDGDGVADGVEDANQDGHHDAGERDPRTAGLHHGAAHLPEPMVFDLVRPLGAREGELEANMLIVTEVRDGHVTVGWAPEVEWALYDGVALELELPMVDAELHALKAAGQVTIPSPDPGFTHGVQLIAEVSVTDWQPQYAAMYLLGGRVGPVTVFGMVGARSRSPHDQLETWDLIANPTVGVDLHETVTIALETNAAFGLDERVRVLLMPQLHWQVVERFRLQVGGGVLYDSGEWLPHVGTRLIIE